MKRFLLLLTFLGSLAFAQPTVSSITFDGIGDSSARVMWNTDAAFDLYRIRYGTSACTGGSGGTLQTNNTNAFWNLQYGMSAQISGLAPSTEYHVCPEVSDDGGMTYSSGVEGTFTTAARTQVLPDPPEAVSMTFPAQGGATLAVASNCSDFQAKIDAAVPGDTIVVPSGTTCTGNYDTPDNPDAHTFTVLSTANSTIRVAMCTDCFADNQEVHFAAVANDNCLPGNKIFPGNAATSVPFFTCAKGGGVNQADRYYLNKIDADDYQVLDAPDGSPVRFGFITFTASAGADTITYVPTVNTPGGYQSGAGGSVAANVSVQFLSTGTLPAGLSADTTYFLLTSCAQSANAACTTQVSLSSGGAAVDITDAGTGTHYIVDVGVGTMYIAAAPAQDDDWILITTDGELPPEGVRMDPDIWGGELFEIKKNDYTNTASFQPGLLAHNWRIVGAKFSGVQDDDYLTTTDPRPVCIGFATAQHNRFINVDRSWIAGNGYPYRTGCRGGGLSQFWMGGYMSITNSYMEDLNFWHPWFGGSGGVNAGGMTPARASASQATLSAGVAHLGKCSVTTGGNVTINFTAGTATASPAAYVYLDMDCNFHVSATNASSTAGNCSVASGTITPGGATPTCTFTTTASPGYPVNGSSRRAGLALFTINLSGGSIPVGGTAIENRTPPGTTTGSAATEGTNYISAGEGPGPFLLYNNFISGSGLTIHFDDGGATFINRHDYTIKQNTFDQPATTLLTGPDSDGLWYGNRQPLEWKSGQRILVEGNNFTGCYAQINTIGVCVIMTPLSGGYITDVHFNGNQFTNVDGCMQYISPTMTFMPASRPGQRQLFENNICLINAFSQRALTEANANGFTFYGNNATEDITIRHNTTFNNRGDTTAWFYLVWSPIGGMVMTDNFYFYTGDQAMFTGEQGICSTQTDKTMMDTCFTSGPGNPSYSFEKNVIVPSWTNSSAQTGKVTTGTITTAFGALAADNFFPNESTVDLNVGFIQWDCGSTVMACSGAEPNLQLAMSSPYFDTGTSMEPVGVDFTEVEDSLGRVGTVSVSSIGTTTATVNIATPSTFGCPVDWSDMMGVPVGDYTRVANAGGSQAQQVNLTGLPENVTVYYRVDCASELVTGSFTTGSQDSVLGVKGPVKISGPVVIR